MFIRKQFVATLALCAAGVVSVAGCDSGAKPQRVESARLTRIVVSPDGAPVLAVPVGSLQFTATGTYSDGSEAEITGDVAWASSNEAVATMSGMGLATMSAQGSTDISASDPATGLAATVAVSVLPAPLVSLDLSPIDPTILIGSSLQLTAWGTLEDESTVEFTHSVTWTSADDAVAAVSTTGVVSAVTLGAAPIFAMDPLTAVSASTTASVTDVLGLAFVALSRGSVVGGSAEVTGVAALTSYAPADVELALWSSDATVVTVPPSVVVAAGTDRVSFPVTTMPVAQKTRVFLWASDGTTEKRASLNVRKQR